MKKQDISYKSRLHKLYNESIVTQLQKKLGYENIMQVPKLLKVVVSTSCKDALTDSKVTDKIFEEMWLITGQKPIITKAKKAIAGFKLKEGAQIGCVVTLRKDSMYDFIDRLINIALPRVKDFRGVSNEKFDGKGNYAFGLKEQIVFPEIDYDRVEKVRGMNIVFVTSAKTDAEAKLLLSMFNFPFIK